MRKLMKGYERADLLAAIWKPSRAIMILDAIEASLI